MLEWLHPRCLGLPKIPCSLGSRNIAVCFPGPSTKSRIRVHRAANALSTGCGLNSLNSSTSFGRRPTRNQSGMHCCGPGPKAHLDRRKESNRKQRQRRSHLPLLLRQKVPKVLERVEKIGSRRVRAIRIRVRVTPKAVSQRNHPRSQRLT